MNYKLWNFKAINERDKELRSALVQTSTKQIADICTLTEKYLLEDDDRVAYSGKDFRMTTIGWAITALSLPIVQVLIQYYWTSASH